MKMIILKTVCVVAVSCSAWLGVMAFPSLGVTLAWNPSISTNVTAYKIYYGPSSGAYTNAVCVGGGTNVTLSNLTAGNTYYFAATAVDSNNVESQFSNETSYAVPTNAYSGPEYLITVQTSTNLITWSNSPIFFRMKIQTQ